MSLLENEWYIQAPWGRICILAWGDCFGPPVLLCHGNMDSAVSYRPLVSQLPKGFYYIGVELPGNGRSDPFPPGLMISLYDLIYALQSVVKHFRWTSFVFIGHSLGALLGKVYNICYPGNISKLIELDPINFMGIEPKSFPQWYKYFFADFYKNYDKLNMPKEKGTKIRVIEGLRSIMNKRPELNEDQAMAVLERITEPAGEGLVRYAFDRRNRLIPAVPFSVEHIKKIFTSVTNPILIIAAQDSIDKKLYHNTVFLLDKKSYPNGNQRCFTVEGGHDVHISHPERLSVFISLFLLNDLETLDSKAKL